MTILHTELVVLIVFLIGLLFGYAAGKRFGRQRFKNRIKAAIALELRRKALQSGVCPTCDSTAQDMVQYGTKG